MKSIKEYIEEAIKVNQSLTSRASLIGTPDANVTKIPTLFPGMYRKISPLLSVRYQMFGFWKNATHGDWLSINEMESLWKNEKNQYIRNIERQIIATSENWPNDVYSLFQRKRISLFAGDENGFERIYLVWLDEVEEPELWVYDSNGTARYKDLQHYLMAYLDDDLSSYSQQWILGLQN